MSLDVALEALSKDAGMWGGVSDVLSTASSTTVGMTLVTSELSWAAEVVGLVPVYEAARARLQTLLSEGATETETISTTLKQVKAAYESNDAAQRAAFAGLWQPK
ncbi:MULTISPECIES: hypothetical protein [unclassified Actinotalea]|uniref:hypothetical protein n=1 Tax=unclassified Actinotalea TaxID=2638618 RepID=UPI0015F52691|nr:MULTISPECIES: hypothetical protein [unclassified Actinotalea]